MSRIEKTFKELIDKGEGALVGYLTMGDPDPQSSERLLECISEKVDILELGIPFSDPIADGPTIQAAMDRALKKGMNTDRAFDIIGNLRKKGIETPFVIMTYYNIILQFGEENFAKKCREKGVDGLLVVDLPIEESEVLTKICEKYGIDTVSLIAPTTSDERIRIIAKKSRGFIYLVSLLGVTGERESVEEKTLESLRSALKLVGDIPLVVGFGISKKEHVSRIIEAGAQGVVVGSAFVRLVSDLGSQACKKLEHLSGELKEGTRINGTNR